MGLWVREAGGGPEGGHAVTRRPRGKARRWTFGPVYEGIVLFGETIWRHIPRGIGPCVDDGLLSHLRGL